MSQPDIIRDGELIFGIASVAIRKGHRVEWIHEILRSTFKEYDKVQITITKVD